MLLTSLVETMLISIVSSPLWSEETRNDAAHTSSLCHSPSTLCVSAPALHTFSFDAMNPIFISAKENPAHWLHGQQSERATDREQINECSFPLLITLYNLNWLIIINQVSCPYTIHCQLLRVAL